MKKSKKAEYSKQLPDGSWEIFTGYGHFYCSNDTYIQQTEALKKMNKEILSQLLKVKKCSNRPKIKQ